MAARLLIGPALAMLGRLTGLRAWHFVLAALGLALALAALAAPFWMLANASVPTLGVLGVLLSVAAYGLCAAALVAVSLIVGGRLVLDRLRRAFQLR